MSTRPPRARRSGSAARSALLRNALWGGALLGVFAFAVITPRAAAQVRERPPLREVPRDSLLVLPPVYGTTDTSRVTAKPVGLREIIRRCVEGERTRLAGHDDMTYTLTVRTALRWRSRKEVRDAVFRMYADADGFARTVQLGENLRKYKRKDDSWVPDDDEESGSKGRVRVESDGYSDFVEMPFFLEEQQEFDFELLERTIEVDHVIFKIAFKPKSSFKPLPSGIVYVDTDAYRIIHEEFEFEQNPFPMFVKDIGRISRHWGELPGGQWVFTKMMMEVELRGGWTGFMPEHVAVALYRDDFEFDTGYDSRIFGER